jgi:predicted Zn finger-like uncharacterized protein
MIAQCPKCGSKYELDEKKFASAPRVQGKCKKCGTRFSVDIPTQVMQAPKTAVTEMPKSSKPADTRPSARVVAEPADVAGPPASPDIPPHLAALAAAAADGRTVVSKIQSDLRLPEGKTVSLSVISGPVKGQLFRLSTPRVVVGRSGADVTITDPEISRQHCAIEVRGPKALLIDLGTTNGTYVDGQRVQSQELHHLMEFHIGQTTVMFTVTDKT